MKKILIIDDETDLCFLMKNILESADQYTVVMAHDGKVGEQLALQERPDLIFLDFVMPEEKGDKVIAFLKKNPTTKRIPIILMSGLGEMVYFSKSDQWKWLPNTDVVNRRGNLPDSLKWKKAPEAVTRDLGVAAYLPKPFTGEVLVELLTDILGKEQKVAEEESREI